MFWAVCLVLAVVAAILSKPLQTFADSNFRPPPLAAKPWAGLMLAAILPAGVFVVLFAIGVRIAHPPKPSFVGEEVLVAPIIALGAIGAVGNACYSVYRTIQWLRLRGRANRPQRHR